MLSVVYSYTVETINCLSKKVCVTQMCIDVCIRRLNYSNKTIKELDSNVCIYPIACLAFPYRIQLLESKTSDVD